MTLFCGKSVATSGGPGIGHFNSKNWQHFIPISMYSRRWSCFGSISSPEWLSLESQNGSNWPERLKGPNGSLGSPKSSFIVWQRFCELARLRIAYCPCLSCPTFFPPASAVEGMELVPSVYLVFAHNQYFLYIQMSLSYPFARQVTVTVTVIYLSAKL